MSNEFGIMVGQIDRCMDERTDGRNVVLFGTAFGEGGSNNTCFTCFKEST